MIVRQYARKVSGPWHLVRDDTFTVCGKSPARLRLQTVTTLGPLHFYRMCARCEHVVSATGTTRLAKP